jgi:ferrous iron transport protein B
MLRHTLAGRAGQILERMTGSIGFDYRINVAILGGFAAKEVIVSTLGTAYSLGEVAPESGGFLAERLAKDPDWNPLVAFTLIIFTMLYVPCFPTLVSIRKESNWRWACFSIIFNLCAAYLVSLFVYQTGLALNFGIR